MNLFTILIITLPIKYIMYLLLPCASFDGEFSLEGNHLLLFIVLFRA